MNGGSANVRYLSAVFLIHLRRDSVRYSIANVGRESQSVAHKRFPDCCCK